MDTKKALKLLLSIAERQQQILAKLAVRAEPGSALTPWERAGVSKQEWDDFSSRVDQKEYLQQMEQQQKMWQVYRDMLKEQGFQDVPSYEDLQEQEPGAAEKLMPPDVEEPESIDPLDMPRGKLPPYFK